MDIIKNKTLKITLGGIAIFTFGIFVGYQLTFGAISSIQGYLFNAVGYATDANASDANASDANASDANATDANASDANASDANATDANATDANYSSTDNIIYLQSFNLASTTAKAGDKVNVNLITRGTSLFSASVTLKNQIDNSTLNVALKSVNNNPYIILPDNLSTASYIVTDVLLIGRNSDGKTFSKRYSSRIGADNYLKLEDKIYVEAKTVVVPIKLNNISLEPLSAKIGDRVNVNFSTNQSLISLKLLFQTSNGQEMKVYPQSLSSNSYFEIPTTAKTGKYSLVSATLISSDSTITYTTNGGNGSEKFAFNSTLEIIEVANESEDVFVYNNEDINNEIIVKLFNASEGTDITINANTNAIIDAELFNTIKGKNKNLIINYNDNQLVFNGNNIINSKDVDASIAVNSIISASDIGKLVPNGIVVNFADNGELPGTAKVRIKATAEVDKIIENGKAYVYFYNEDANNFCIIATNVLKTNDGYYEFTISHNSDYILVDQEIDSKLVVEKNNNNNDIVSFQKSNNLYLLLIGVGVLVIVAVGVTIIIVKRKNKKIDPTTSFLE